MDQKEAALRGAAELEIEMMSDLYKRMTRTCEEKCISTSYKDAELTKGESVCIDRCVSKFLDLHERLGKTLTGMTQQDDKQAAQAAQQRAAK